MTRTAKLCVGLLSLVTTGFGAFAQDALPDGPNRVLVTRKCSTCHDLGTVTGNGGRTRQAWEGVVEDMTLFGMSVTDAERGEIVEYLATYLPPSR